MTPPESHLLWLCQACFCRWLCDTSKRVEERVRTGKGDSNNCKTGWANLLAKAGWRRKTAILFSSFCTKTAKERSTSKRCAGGDAEHWDVAQPFAAGTAALPGGRAEALFVHFVLCESRLQSLNRQPSTINPGRRVFSSFGQKTPLSVRHRRWAGWTFRDRMDPRDGGDGCSVRFVKKPRFQSISHPPSTPPPIRCPALAPG